MKTATIRDLRNSFPTVVITKSGKPFARWAPIPPEPKVSAAMPDFLGRMKASFPDEKPGSLGPVVDFDRGDR
jgi:antitoxin (DNA-binding transcriptional repressor) of toxin-antitoxin stability system